MTNVQSSPFKPVRVIVLLEPIMRLMQCQDCGAIYEFYEAGHDEEYFCPAEGCKGKGQLCGCDGCHAKAFDTVKSVGLAYLESLEIEGEGH